MDAATVVTVGLVTLAVLGIWLLPMRKRWNDDGSADAARTGPPEQESRSDTAQAARAHATAGPRTLPDAATGADAADPGDDAGRRPTTSEVHP